MTDEVITYDDVARWLPTEIREELLRAMPPQMRGWYTEAEVTADGGRFVDVTRLGDPARRYLRTN